MAAPQTIAQFAKLVDPAVRKHFIDEYKQRKPMIDKVFNVMDQKDYNEQHQNYLGLGGLAPVGEAEVIPEGSMLQGYGTTYTPTKYAELLPISYELKKFQKADLVTKAAGAQAKQVARSVELNAAAVMNRSTNTSYTSYGDSKPLGSTGHTSAGGFSAQSNASATGITLTEANIEVAQIAMEEVLDDQNQAIDVYADCLMVPLALRKEAVVFTKSDLKATTANNDLNAYNAKNGSLQEFKGLIIPKLIVWNYLSAYLGGSDTRWFMLDSMNHKINWLWADKPTIGERDTSVGYKTDLMYWKVRYIASTGWDDWRGFWVSNGDGAAYAS